MPAADPAAPAAVVAYNPNLFTVAKLKSALTPNKLEIIDSLLAWVGFPALNALSVWLTKLASNPTAALEHSELTRIEAILQSSTQEVRDMFNSTLSVMNDAMVSANDAAATKAAIDKWHTALIVSQFVYLGLAVTRLAMNYRADYAKFNQYMLDEGVYSEDDFKRFKNDKRHAARKLLQAVEIAGVAASGVYLASPDQLGVGGAGLILSMGVAGNLADYLLKQSRLMFARHTQGAGFADVDANVYELAKGFGWKFFGIFSIPAIAMVLANSLTEFGKQRDPDGNIAIGPTAVYATAFGFLAIAASFKKGLPASFSRAAL